MPDYVSTNIRLPKEQLKLLKLKAVEEGKSMGQVVREALSRGLNLSGNAPQATSPSRLGKENPFAKIIGLGNSGVSDSGTNHDKYLYGKSKREWKS